MFKIAQLGAGRMGGVHAGNAAAHSSLDLAYIVDPRADAAERLAQATGAQVATLEQVLSDADVKGVIVASATDCHLDHVLVALGTGKAVFCEKPLDLDLTRLRAAESHFGPQAPALFVAFNRRFDRHVRALKTRIDSGVIGTLETLHVVNHDPESPPAGFIPGSGGLFKDFTIHDLDLAPWLLGERVVEIFAWASCLVDPEIGRLGDVDTAKLVLRTGSGRLCTLSNSRRTGYGYDQRIEAFGSKGMARMDNEVQSTVSVWGADGARSDAFPYAFMNRYAGAYAAELDHFAQVLAGTAKPETGYQASIDALALAEAAALSVQTGQPVKL